MEVKEIEMRISRGRKRRATDERRGGWGREDSREKRRGGERRGKDETMKGKRDREKRRGTGSR